MTKKNKKNWVVRLMSLTLLFTLISGCLMSGTLAKYVTTGATNAKDTARVAKWGVKIDGEAGLGLFNTKYEFDDEDLAAYFTGDFSVNTDPDGDGMNLVAPGTKYGNWLSGLGIKGKPEVAAVISFKINGATSKQTGWTLCAAAADSVCENKHTASEAYNPVEWSWNVPTGDATSPVMETGRGTFNQMLTALKNKDIAIYCPPNTDLEQAFGENSKYYIKWEWPFESTKCGKCGFCLGTDDTMTSCQNPISIAENDIKDTCLGNQEAAAAKDVVVNSFEIKYAGAITVAQVD